ncbi:hypothetical protein pb186bvf_017548 [Paramecium bursaria]
MRKYAELIQLYRCLIEQNSSSIFGFEVNIKKIICLIQEILIIS